MVFTPSHFGILAALLGVSTALYSSKSDVVILNEDVFNDKVLKSDSVWLVEFFAPWCGHCKSLVPTWDKAATALKGIVRVGAVDADSERSLGSQFGIKGFPTIKIFGADKQKPIDYQGARTPEAIVAEALKVAKKMADDRLSGKKTGGSGGGSKSGGGGGGGSAKDAVIELTDSNFEELVINSEDHWLVEFFAPWCGHCKQLAPQFASAASELKGKVKLGAVDATVQTIISGKFNVKGYPTLKYFPPGKKSHSDAEEYNGGRTSDDIVKWCNDKVEETLPPPDIKELLNGQILKDACDNHQICVITVLPHLFDTGAVGRNQYIQLLKNLADKYKKSSWGWVWTAAGTHSQLEEALGIGGFGYPALAALNSRKGKFAILKGSFGMEGIDEHLRAVKFGRGSSEPLRASGLPELQTVEAWDGKDVELPEEEDIDLSDFDMDEEESTETKDEL